MRRRRAGPRPHGAARTQFSARRCTRICPAFISIPVFVLLFSNFFGMLGFRGEMCLADVSAALVKLGLSNERVNFD